MENKKGICSEKADYLKKGGEMKNKKVLVVDDEPDSISFIEAILEDKEMNIITAADGEEGIKKAKSEKPDIIIMDVQMPKMDGFQASAKIKSLPETKDIPIIILTGVKDKTGIGFGKDDISKFYGREVEEYIEKPIEPEKLVEALRRCLKN